MAEEIELRVVSRADSKGFNQAAKDIKSLKGESDRLGGSFDVAEGEAFDLGEALDEARRRAAELRAEFAKSGDTTLLKGLREQRSFVAQLSRIQREMDEAAAATDALGGSFEATEDRLSELNAALVVARKRAAELRAELAKGGGPPIIPGRSAEETSILAEIQRVREELSREGGGLGITAGAAAGTAAGRRFSDGFVGSLTSGSFHSKAVKALVALAVFASPAIGAMIGGAVVGLTGTGGIVGGILAASQDPRVKSAGRDGSPPRARGRHYPTG